MDRIVKPLSYCTDCGKSITKGCKHCRQCSCKNNWIEHRDAMMTAAKSESRINAARKIMNDKWSDVDYRLLASERMKSLSAKIWSDPKHRQYISNAIGKANKIRWQDVNYRKHMSQLFSVRASECWANENFSMNLFIPSSLEMKFKYMLDEAGIKCKQQYKPIGYNRVYDFLLLDYHTLVEIDGNYWHYSEYAKQRGVPERDVEKEKYAIENGYDFVRIPEDELATTIVTDWLLPELVTYDI